MLSYICNLFVYCLNAERPLGCIQTKPSENTGFSVVFNKACLFLLQWVGFFSHQKRGPKNVAGLAREVETGSVCNPHHTAAANLLVISRRHEQSDTTNLMSQSGSCYV